jgi:hypothetical protein
MPVRLLAQIVDDPLAVMFFKVVLTVIGVLGALGQECVDEACELVGGGADCLSFAQAGGQTAVVGPERGLCLAR